MRLSGAQTTNAQLNETAGSMERVGAAAATAGDEAAAGSAGISKFAAAGTGAGIAGMASKFQSASKSMQTAGASMMVTGKKMTTHLSLPILAIGGYAVHSAADFDAAMQLINTQAGASQKEVHRLSKQVLDLAKVSPQG